jgi:hypothetical protein
MAVPMIDVVERHLALREQLPALKLYALVDGAQYEAKRGERLQARAGVRSLFEGTADEGLAHAGGWLVDTDAVALAWVEDLARLERQAPAVSWLITAQDMEGLVQLLRLNLEAELPDGRKALLRFYDPRVLAALFHTLDGQQRQAFCGWVHEWHLFLNGERAHIGRADA